MSKDELKERLMVAMWVFWIGIGLLIGMGWGLIGLSISILVSTVMAAQAITTAE